LIYSKSTIPNPKLPLPPFSLGDEGERLPGELTEMLVPEHELGSRGSSGSGRASICTRNVGLKVWKSIHRTPVEPQSGGTHRILAGALTKVSGRVDGEDVLEGS